MTNKPTTSLAKALRLLRLLGAHGGWLGVRELARQAGYTPSSAHGLLKVLLADGFVEFDTERRQYRLGLAILALADGIDAADALGSFARPWMSRLVADLGETVFALSWRGGRALVVACAEAQHDLRVSTSDRVLERPHHWASGQVLVAWLPEDERRAYAQRMYPDAAGAAGLLAALDVVRSQGWASAIDDEGSGVAAYGAPVLDAGGRCVLAIGSSAPLSRASSERQRHMRERLLATAGEMAAALGNRPS
jgi:IclR family acetate operon transcriptional repressor